MSDIDQIGFFTDGPAAIAKDKIADKDARISELKVALRAIACGYPIKVQYDQYIQVQNPDYREDNGSDPYLVIDVATL